MKLIKLLNRNSGFTLLEMIVVMAVFTVVIVIAGKSFDLVVKQMGIISKSEESNVEGLIGLEMFRKDLAQAGFGLFTDVQTPGLVYAEAAAVPGSNYNDSPSGIPRAAVAGDNLNLGDDSKALTGTDYLALKGTTLAINKASQKWSYIKGTSTTAPKVWGTNDFKLSPVEYNIVFYQKNIDGKVNRTLINDPSSSTQKFFTNTVTYSSPYKPQDENFIYYYYGISDQVPRAPFNRTDYLVYRSATDMPATCSPATGVLYKMTLNYADGNFTPIPIMDCVADMQIVLGWNVSGFDNIVDYYTNADGTVKSGTATPEYPVNMSDSSYIRQHLKLIKVYILTQDGGYDKSYTNTNTAMVVGDPDLGEATLTKTVNLTTANMKNYRWKLHRLIVQPKNLTL